MPSFHPQTDDSLLHRCAHRAALTVASQVEGSASFAIHLVIHLVWLAQQLQLQSTALGSDRGEASQ